MKLIVGLGNPGNRYELNRHNIGFLCVDQMQDAWSARGPKIQHKGQIFETEIAGEKVWLAKPQTYMNLSGETVGPIFKFFKLKPEDLIVVYDELDIPANTFRIKVGGGAAGHNGIKSIQSSVGNENQNFLKIRMGIGRPQGQIEPGDYVLQNFKNHELDEWEKTFPDVIQAVDWIIRGKKTEAMNKFNQKKSKDSE